MCSACAELNSHSHRQSSRAVTNSKYRLMPHLLLLFCSGPENEWHAKPKQAKLFVCRSCSGQPCVCPRLPLRLRCTLKYRIWYNTVQWFVITEVQRGRIQYSLSQYSTAVNTKVQNGTIQYRWYNTVQPGTAWYSQKLHTTQQKPAGKSPGLVRLCIRDHWDHMDRELRSFKNYLLPVTVWATSSE